MSLELSLGFSPCPNDTFIFHALVTGRVGVLDVTFRPQLHDVETLNRFALAGRLDVTKVSYGVVPQLTDYALLRSGGALGRGCGPLIVARETIDPVELREKRVAIPGRFTTASLLFRSFAPDASPGIEMPYDRIMPAVEAGEVDAGLIIHESRFTYRDHGLVKVVDLGEWWERVTGLPIPLGAIVARKSLGADRIAAIDAAIRSSVEYAFAHPDASREYVRAHAQEMSQSVMQSHIDLYVNEHSIDLGEDGESAVERILEESALQG